ncbi:hypothetical protein HDV06_006254 [Boothiomyces sp. JEL0866]|nr:hypothetical protein HDV06_006254 [Boothiomyces sp. JEL0866]
MYNANHWFLFFEVVSAGFLIVEILQRVAAYKFNLFEKINILSGVACIICSLFDNIIYRPDYEPFDYVTEIALEFTILTIATVTRCIYLHYTTSRCLSMSSYKKFTKIIGTSLVIITGVLQTLGSILYVKYYTIMSFSTDSFDNSNIFGVLANWVYLANEFIEKPAILCLEFLFFVTFWEKMTAQKVYKGMEEESRLTIIWNVLLLIGITMQLIACVLAVLGINDPSTAMNWYQFNTNVSTFVNLKFRTTVLNIITPKSTLSSGMKQASSNVDSSSRITAKKGQ